MSRTLGRVTGLKNDLNRSKLKPRRKTGFFFYFTLNQLLRWFEKFERGLSKGEITPTTPDCLQFSLGLVSCALSHGFTIHAPYDKPGGNWRLGEICGNAGKHNMVKEKEQVEVEETERELEVAMLKREIVQNIINLRCMVGDVEASEFMERNSVFPF